MATFDPFVSGASEIAEGSAAQGVQGTVNGLYDPFYGLVPRLTLFDLTKVGEDNSSLEVQFNPSEFEEEISALYGKLQPVGQPHQVLQYQGTENHKVNLTLFYLAQDVYTKAQGKRAKKWLMSLLYPNSTQGTGTIAQTSPPDVLVVWPGTLSMVCRLMRVRFSNQRFSRSGEVVQFEAACTFEEHRTTRWTSDDAREYGSFKVPAES